MLINFILQVKFDFRLIWFNWGWLTPSPTRQRKLRINLGKELLAWSQIWPVILSLWNHHKSCYIIMYNDFNQGNKINMYRSTGPFNQGKEPGNFPSLQSAWPWATFQENKKENVTKRTSQLFNTLPTNWLIYRVTWNLSDSLEIILCRVYSYYW